MKDDYGTYGLRFPVPKRSNLSGVQFSLDFEEYIIALDISFPIPLRISWDRGISCIGMGGQITKFAQPFFSCFGVWRGFN
jgi:hypothetical protein